MKDKKDFNLQEYLDHYKKVVNKKLKELLPSKDKYPPSIHQSMHYSVFAGGKRIRPILAIATYQMYRNDIEKVLPAACSIELLHTFSLIHDDLPAMDNDDFRRGKPTNHKVFGEAIAILAGDALCVEAFRILGKTGNARAVELLGEAIGVGGVISGQVVDIESENKEAPKEELEKTLEFIHLYKTAALIRASILIGALYAEAPEEDFKVLSEFGNKIGLIFQIVDDILDITSTPEVLGKDVGSDIEKGKLTYPRVYGIEASYKKAYQLLDEALELLLKIERDTIVLEEIAKFFIKRIN